MISIPGAAQPVSRVVTQDYWGNPLLSPWGDPQQGGEKASSRDKTEPDPIAASALAQAQQQQAQHQQERRLASALAPPTRWSDRNYYQSQDDARGEDKAAGRSERLGNTISAWPFLSPHAALQRLYIAGNGGNKSAGKSCLGEEEERAAEAVLHAGPLHHRAPRVALPPPSRGSPAPPPGGQPLMRALVVSLVAAGGGGLAEVKRLDLGLERLVDLSGIQQWCPEVEVRGPPPLSGLKMSASGASVRAEPLRSHDHR